MRKAAVWCGAVGLLLLAAAGLLAFWITPQFVARLPSGTNTTRTYQGTIASLVDPAALATGNFAAAIKAGLPLTLTTNVKVQQTSGDMALVQATNTLKSSGRQIGATKTHYAVDRTSLEASARHPGDWAVTAASGLVVSWPIGAGQQNYRGWVDQTYTTTELRYLRQVQHGGVSTYEYQTTVAPARVKNAQVLQGLPKSVPVRLLQTAAKAGLLPSGLVASVVRAFPHATQVPLGYTYSGTSTYWVAPTTGEVIDIKTSERQVGGAALPGGRLVPLLPVLVDNYLGTTSSVHAAATDATNNANTITLLGTTLPIIAAAVGFVLVVLAIAAWARGGQAAGGRGRHRGGAQAPG